jgi:hypothetical protein
MFLAITVLYNGPEMCLDQPKYALNRVMLVPGSEQYMALQGSLVGELFARTPSLSFSLSLSLDFVCSSRPGTSVSHCVPIARSSVMCIL